MLRNHHVPIQCKSYCEHIKALYLVCLENTFHLNTFKEIWLITTVYCLKAVTDFQQFCFNLNYFALEAAL